MGPCPRCGQQTETDANFCPACAGYAAPATVYSYAPGRLVQPRDEGPAPRLAALPVTARVASRPAALAPSAGPAVAEFGYPGRRSGRRIALAATLAVVLIAVTTVGLVLATHRPASSRPRASAPAAGRAPSRVTHAASPAPAAGQVRVAASAAGGPHLAAVLAFLNSYFTAINGHDYAAYQLLFDPVVRGAESAAAFSAGYGTTTDSAITLQSVGTIGAGELVAQVSFVSQQQPSASPTNSSCTDWTISLYLLGQDGTYLLQQPPAGYQPSYAACG